MAFRCYVTNILGDTSNVTVNSYGLKRWQSGTSAVTASMCMPLKYVLCGVSILEYYIFGHLSHLVCVFVFINKLLSHIVGHFTSMLHLVLFYRPIHAMRMMASERNAYGSIITDKVMFSTVKVLTTR